MSKVMSSGTTGKGVTFAKGGSTKMFGKGGADASTAGQSAPTSKPGPGAKFASGGKTKMFSKGHATAQVPGQSVKTSQ